MAEGSIASGPARGPVYAFEGHRPRVAADAFIAPTAAVIGQVEIGAQSGVWFHCVLRGDTNFIRIGQRSNIQDGTIIHVNAGAQPTIIGDDVTVGHGCIIHACTLEDRTFVGMGATVLDGAVVGAQSLIGANALVTPGTRIPPGSLVVGAPAVVKRALSAEERAGLKHWAEKYVVNGAYCLGHGINVGKPLET